LIQVSKGTIPPFEVENIRVEVWIYHGSGKGVEVLEG